ncbi:MAG: hypothetical protein K0Q79_3388 [Flavipsychrobacter sp.]|jgi:hypothetical protein|nr:hypothetical protein [Flavipsychrobacter sp.]
MDKIVVYSAHNSNRLKYVLGWLLKERLQLDYAITHNEQDVANISYGRMLQGCLSIPDDGLLWQTGKEPHNVKTGEWNSIPTLFSTTEAGYSLPFDLFSAIFFLLSRYEEYDHHKPDKHDRYPATNSILHKQGWLQRPLVDEWVTELRKQLQIASGLSIQPTHFSFQPTYDIDMAYSHIHKGVGRIVGAYMRAFLKGDLRQVAERTKVLKKKQKDPFDSFRWLRQLHREYDARPLYFVLSAAKTTAFDKNIHPRHPAMMRVIKNLVKDGAIGIHPSYYSAQDNKMKEEMDMLGNISGTDMHISRQHYIRIKIPDTCRLLLKNNIKEDYSMGYGSHLGFRAGTGSSFLWYDLENEATTDLRIHPFCFMDTTAHYEARLPVSDAFNKLNAMSKILERTGSTLITVFHNFSLGTSNEWKGWRQAYEHFMQEKANAHAGVNN